MSYRAASASSGSMEPLATSQAFSLIDQHTHIDGALMTRQDLRVDGQVQGTLQCDGTLYVSEGATVDAAVDAAHIVVAGQLTGEVLCRGRLEIQESGAVRATVQTSALVIHEGAVYEGQLTMVAPPPATEAETEPSEPEVAPPTVPEQEPYSFLRRFASLPADDADDDLPATGNAEPPEDDEP